MTDRTAEECASENRALVPVDGSSVTLVDREGIRPASAPHSIMPYRYIEATNMDKNPTELSPDDTDLKPIPRPGSG